MNSERIRWENTKHGGWTGHVGTLDSWAFQIFKTGLGYAGWSLTAQLPGALGEAAYNDDPDELKAEAERLLSDFVVSLGAVFPGRHARHGPHPRPVPVHLRNPGTPRWTACGCEATPSAVTDPVLATCRNCLRTRAAAEEPAKETGR